MIKLPLASYIAGEIEEYCGHPLINALPPINSPQDTARMLNRYPVVAEEEKSLPAHIRRHAMMRILDQFLYPTKSHLQLEQMISGMLRRGYLSRNIADPSYQRNLDDAGRLDFKRVARNAGNEALVSSVIGCSGTGKSTAVEAILQGYPQAIYHPEYQHAQLVWLKVESPHDGSVRNLCVNFFRAIDDALGTDYLQIYVKDRSSADSMLGDIARLSALHSLGLLVIDEIQHLEKTRSGGSAKILNFFVTLTNVLKVPVLFIGTPKALELFSPTMRSARRSAQFGSLDWSRFSRSGENGPDGEWERFIERLWKLQWFKTPTPLAPPMSNLCWEYTQGVAHIAVALFYLSQARAVMTGREALDQALITKVYNDELSIIHPMINALRSGRDANIRKFSDLDLPKETVRVLAPVSPQDETFESESEETRGKQAKLVDMLVQMGIGRDIAPIVAEQAIEEKPDEDLFGLVAHIKNLQDRPEPSAKEKSSNRKKRAPLKPVYLEKDLRLLRSDDPLETYKSFKNSGIIIDVSNYL